MLPVSELIFPSQSVANVAKKTKKPSVVSLSFSGPPNAGLDAACNALVKKGIHVVVAG